MPILHFIREQVLAMAHFAFVPTLAIIFGGSILISVVVLMMVRLRPARPFQRTDPG